MGPLEAIRAWRAASKLQSALDKADWRTVMGGWKTWAGAGLMAASTALNYLGCAGCDAISDSLLSIGQIFFGVGVAHKLEKSAGAIAAALKR